MVFCWRFMMKKGICPLIVLAVLILSLLLTGMAAGQGLPDLSGRSPRSSVVLPDPGNFLSTAGNVFEKDYRYNGVIYDAYLYGAPENESEFLTNYYIAAAEAGFEPELAFVEKNKAMKICSPGKTGDPALLMYDYQGYVLLMVPKDMNFTQGSGGKPGRSAAKITLPTATPALRPTSTPTPKPTSTPKPTATKKPTSTPTRVPTATKTPTPRPTYDPNAGYEKYRVTGAGIYGFQIRPYANTDWFYKEQYQHPVYNGDIVYYTGSTQNGPGYDKANIKWMSVRTPDGFTGWLPAYILTKAK